MQGTIPNCNLFQVEFTVLYADEGAVNVHSLVLLVIKVAEICTALQRS